MVLDKMHYAVKASVHRSAVRVLFAEIFSARTFLISRDMDRMVNEFFDTLTFDCRDRNHRHTENVFHLVDPDRSAISFKFVHHVERENHRHVELHELHSKIKIPLDIRRVHDIYDRGRLLIQDESARYHFLAAVWGK